MATDHLELKSGAAGDSDEKENYDPVENLTYQQID